MSTTKLTFRIFKGVAARLKINLDQLYLKRDGFIEHLLDSEISYLKSALSDKKNSKSARAFINQKMNKKRLTDQITVVIKKSVAEKIKKVTAEHNLSRDAFVNRLLIFALLNNEELEALGIESNASEIESTIGYVERTPSSPLSALSYWMEEPLFLIRESLKLSGENMYLMDLDILSRGLNAMTACFLADDLLPNPESDGIAHSMTIDDFLPEAS